VRLSALAESKSSLMTAIAPKKMELVEVRANCDKVTTSWKLQEAKLRTAHSAILKVLLM
jgi:hypothetical protein